MSEAVDLEAMMLRAGIDGCKTPLRGVVDRCQVLDEYAESAAASGIERAVVRGIIEAAFDKFIEPLIRHYNPPGPDVAYVAAARWIVCALAMRGYDMVKDQEQ